MPGRVLPARVGVGATARGRGHPVGLRLTEGVDRGAPFVPDAPPSLQATPGGRSTGPGSRACRSVRIPLATQFERVMEVATPHDHDPPPRRSESSSPPDPVLKPNRGCALIFNCPKYFTRDPPPMGPCLWCAGAPCAFAPAGQPDQPHPPHPHQRRRGHRTAWGTASIPPLEGGLRGSMGNPFFPFAPRFVRRDCYNSRCPLSPPSGPTQHSLLIGGLGGWGGGAHTARWPGARRCTTPTTWTSRRTGRSSSSAAPPAGPWRWPGARRPPPTVPCVPSDMRGCG